MRCTDDAHSRGGMRLCLAAPQGSAPCQQPAPGSPYLLSEVASLLRPHFIHPVRSSLLKVGLDARLERLILPDGGRAEGRACELGDSDKGSVTAPPRGPGSDSRAHPGLLAHPGHGDGTCGTADQRDPQHDTVL